MRSQWKGALGFGMVSIPVKLYGAVDSKSRTETTFASLHAECGTRIKMPKYCPSCEKFLQPEELGKAYEIGKEQYVPLSDAELANLPLPSIQTIAIEQFISYDNLPDERWYKSCYFLSPEKAGTKAFALFAKTMNKLEVAGIAKIAMRGKEHLCLVLPYKGILALQTLYWADQVKEVPDELKVAAECLSGELEMAEKLISAMTGTPHWEKYEDGYKKALFELVEAKTAGGVIGPIATAKVTEADLAKALLASLKAMEEVKV